MFSGVSQKFWINLAGFQVAWWCLILFGNSAATLVTFLLIIHLLLHSKPSAELKVLIICGVVGFAVDTLLTFSQFFIFYADGSEVPPFWLLLLWFAFSATLRQSLNFFSHRYLLAAVCGSLAGSLTYLAAARLEAVSLGLPLIPAFVVLACRWALLFPLLVWIGDRVGARYEFQTS